MNRHLTIVELDARLFASAAEAAGFVERAVARSLLSEAAAPSLGHVDLRPAITCVAAAGTRDQAVRFIDGEGGDVCNRFDNDMRLLGLYSTASLVAELAARAENGHTDRGLDYATTVDA